MAAISRVTKSTENRVALVAVYVIATIWLIALLFPLYYTVVLSTADRAATIEVPPRLDFRLARVATISLDLTPFVKENMNLPRAELEKAIKGEVAVAAARPLYLVRDLMASRVIASVNGQVIAEAYVPEWKLGKYYGKWENMGPDRPRAEGDQFFEAFEATYYPQVLDGQATRSAPAFPQPQPDTLAGKTFQKLVADNTLKGDWMLTVDNSLNDTLNNFRWAIGPAEIWTDLRQASVPRWFINSMIYAIGAVLSQLIISSIAGYALSRLWSRRMAYWLQLFFLATMMLPPFMIFLPLFLMMKNFPLPTVPFTSIQLPGVNLMNTFFALILPHTAWGFSILLFRGFFDQLPDELFQAARIDGSSELHIFLRIAIPLSQPIFATLTIFTFMAIWAEFAWPYLVANRQEMWTLSIGLFQSAGAAGSGGGDPGRSTAMAVISAIPPLFIFTFFQRYLVGSIALTGIKG
ncbi:MAG: carbohydrate ABC transporter permease [Chloroflexi bacterium]|nr:carbohydrate ABC transporter permease [Chloroflexota bacterium]